MKFDQTERLIKLEGPFDPATCYPTSLTATEEISQLFQCHVEFLSTDLDLQGKDVLGKKATVELFRFDEEGKHDGSRFFHGIINRLQGGELGVHQHLEYRRYQIQIVPELWLLTRGSDCHVYSPELPEKTIDKVISGMFTRAGFDMLKRDFSCPILSNTYIEHCVQYRETYFNFFSRLLEQYGVHYYFEHARGSHTLKVCENASRSKCEEAEIDFPKQSNKVQDNCILSWEGQFDFITGKFDHKDYNFTTPLDSLQNPSSQVSRDLPADASKVEVYDYPGEFADSLVGERLSRIRQEEHESRYHVFRGTSSCKTFTAGHTFKLKSHPDQSSLSGVLQEYRLLRVQHRAVQPFEQGDHIQYSNSFECAAADRAFRPRRVTPKPLIAGVQTAVVTGPKDEEIYTDEYGRVRVVFHWDRDYRKESRYRSEGANCSCWVRVAQSAAGRNWGTMFLPRIGQEVVVEFLEGDPDRPLVVGSVYNADQRPPYNPVEHKTRSYLKTCSSMDGEGYNELMFEDLAGQEMVYMHAQRNMDFRVRNDSLEMIYGNRYQRIGWDDQDKEVGGNQVEQIRLNKSLNVKQDQDEHIEGTYKLTVGHGEGDNPGVVHYDFEKSWMVNVGDEGMHMTVSGDACQKVGGNTSLTIDGDLDLSCSNARVETDTDCNIKAGSKLALDGTNVHVKAGSTLVLEAGTGLTLKVGGNFITIASAGIFIKGSIVGINSGGAALSGMGCDSASPTEPTESEQAAPPTPRCPILKNLAHLPISSQFCS